MCLFSAVCTIHGRDFMRINPRTILEGAGDNMQASMSVCVTPLLSIHTGDEAHRLGERVSPLRTAKASVRCSAGPESPCSPTDNANDHHYDSLRMLEQVDADASPQKPQHDRASPLYNFSPTSRPQGSARGNGTKSEPVWCRMISRHEPLHG